jgi:hypothetical protein
VIELISISNSFNYEHHVVGLVWIMGNDVVKDFSGALVLGISGGPWFVSSFD